MDARSDSQLRWKYLFRPSPCCHRYFLGIRKRRPTPWNIEVRPVSLFACRYGRRRRSSFSRQLYFDATDPNARRAERRDHLNLQIDLISEKEITKVLQLTRALCHQMGLQEVADDTELKELSEETSVETLSQRLEDTLPES